MNSPLLFELHPKHSAAIRLLKNHMILAGKSKRTINSYVSIITRIIKKLKRLPEECSKHELIDFLIKYKTTKDCKNSTIKIFVYALRYYLINVAENLDLSFKIPCPKIKPYNIQVLSINEIKSLLNACSDSRQKLIIQILYETGMRLSELEKLSLENIDFDFKCITILNSKNKRSRTVKFGEALEKAIRNYLSDFPSLFSNTLFANKLHPFIPLSSNGIYWNLKYISKKTNITKNVFPHLLRHTFAVHYLNFGGTIYQLKNILGHENMATTLNYLQYSLLPESKNISILDTLMNSDNLQP